MYAKQITEIEMLLITLETATFYERDVIENRIMQLATADPESLIPIISANTGKRSYLAARMLGRVVRESENFSGRIKSTMMGFLTSSNFMLRLITVQLIGNFGQNTDVQYLINQLNDEKTVVQIEVVRSLGKLGDPQAVRPLIDLLLKSDSSTLRYTIIGTLDLLGDQDTVSVIRTFASDPDAHVRSKVKNILQKFE